SEVGHFAMIDAPNRDHLELLYDAQRALDVGRILRVIGTPPAVICAPLAGPPTFLKWLVVDVCGYGYGSARPDKKRRERTGNNANFHDRVLSSIVWIATRSCFEDRRAASSSGMQVRPASHL